MSDSVSTDRRLSWRELGADVFRRGAMVWVFGAIALQLAEVAGRLIGARILGPDQQGTVEVLIAWAATGMLIAGGGFATSAHIHISDTNDAVERQAIFTVGALGILASWGMLAAGGLTVLLATSWIPEAVRTEGGLILAVILAGGFGEPRFGLFGLLGTGLKRYAAVGRGRCLVGAVYVLGWVGGAYLLGVRGALIGWIVALMVGGAYLARYLGLPLIFGLAARQRARRVGLHAFQCLGNQMTSRVTEYLCIFLLTTYAVSLDEIGNFGVAMAASKVLLLIPAMFGSLSLPYLVATGGDPAYHRRLSRMLFWSILFVTVVSWLCLAAAARWLIPSILPGFLQAEPLFQVLALSAVATAITQPLGIRFLSLHRPFWNLVVNVASLATLVVAGVYWVPGQGTWGMACAWCTMTFFRFVGMLGLSWIKIQRGGSAPAAEAAGDSGAPGSEFDV